MEVKLTCVNRATVRASVTLEASSATSVPSTSISRVFSSLISIDPLSEN